MVDFLTDLSQTEFTMSSPTPTQVVVSPTNVDIKLANSSSEAEAGTGISINALGGVLKIASRVSDKKSGDVGHPIQYDNALGQWYIKVSTASTDNQIRTIRCCWSWYNSTW